MLLIRHSRSFICGPAPENPESYPKTKCLTRVLQLSERFLLQTLHDFFHPRQDNCVHGKQVSRPHMCQLRTAAQRDFIRAMQFSSALKRMSLLDLTKNWTLDIPIALRTCQTCIISKRGVGQAHVKSHMRVGVVRAQPCTI